MRRRLLTAMLLVSFVAVAGFGLPLALAVRALYRDEALLTLSASAARAVVAVPGSFAVGKDLPELPVEGGGVRTALYDVQGSLVVGRGPRRADAAVAATLAGRGAQRRVAELVVTMPVTYEERVVGVIRTDLTPGVVAGRTRRTWLAMAGLAVVVLAAATLVAAYRARGLTEPLSSLRDDAALIGGGGELPARADTGLAEVDTVRAALAGAVGRLNHALARERAFSADLAHQLRTPLTSLRLRLETGQLQPTPTRAVLDEALVDVDRLTQTVDDLVLLARDTGLGVEAHPLATPLREAVERWQPIVERAGRRLVFSHEPQLPWTLARPAAVRQVLDVLLDNALRHGAGDVSLSASCLQDGAVVAVGDSGGAVLDGEQVFLRRSPQAAGSGIGLALARRLAEAEEMRLILQHAGPGPVFHLVVVGAGSNRLPRDRQRR